MALKAGTSARTNTTAFMAGDEGNELFGPRSTLEISNIVQVDDEPIVVRAHHLGEGECVLVEMVDGGGAGEHFSPYMRSGCQVRLTRKCNQIAIAFPGRYRFVLEGALGVAYVRYFRASMTHEFLLENQSMGCCDESPTCLPPCGPAGGDLQGEYPNPQVNPLQLVDRIIEKESAITLLAGALCDAMSECIRQVAEDASIKVTGVTFNASTNILTINSSDGASIQIDLSSLQVVATADGVEGSGTTADPVRARLSEAAGNALTLRTDGLYVAVGEPALEPSSTTGDELPTRIYGARTAVLGDPAGWVDIGGGKKIPYWI